MKNPILSEVAHSFLDQFFPRLCISCQRTKPVYGQKLCLDCMMDIPFTDQHLFGNNPFTEHFWGRVPIRSGSAMMLLDDGDKVRNMIHCIKYDNGHKLAYEMGRWYGRTLKESNLYKGITHAIPVPLHPRKKKQRGFNQAEFIARGIAEGLEVECRTDLLSRIRYTKTQTKKNRIERVENLREVFKAQPGDLRNTASLLLVDDVLTTGATLESCALALMEAYPQVSISMCTLAMGYPY